MRLPDDDEIQIFLGIKYYPDWYFNGGNILRRICNDFSIILVVIIELFIVNF